jgi:hypothetical protein
LSPVEKSDVADDKPVAGSPTCSPSVDGRRAGNNSGADVACIKLPASAGYHQGQPGSPRAVGSIFFGGLSIYLAFGATFTGFLFTLQEGDPK